MTATPWRQDGKVPQNVYAADGAPIAQFHDAPTAALVVAAVNNGDALADALERLLAMLASDAINIECAYRADAEILHERENAARIALRAAGRLP